MDFTASVCNQCTDVEFRPYQFLCDTQDADLQAIGLAICGTTIACPTILNDYTTEISANKFRVIHGVSGSKAAPTQNEVDLSTYSCMPEKQIKDYSEVLNFNAVNQIENHPFWNQIRKSSDIIQQAFYVNKSGIVYEIPSKPSMFVYYGADSGIDVVVGTIEWKTNCLETPFRALSEVWKCA